METMRVYWPGKFEGVVTINATDFDAEKHVREEDGPPEEESGEAKPKRRGRKSEE